MKDLTSLFSRTKEWDRGLILTYDLNPISFFETQLLNKINVRQNLTVVIDAANLQRLLETEKIKPQYNGVYYNLEGIKVKNGGCFHPKLYLFESKDEVFVALGSFNLTETGFKKNLETVLQFDIKRKQLSNNDLSLLNEIGGFLEKIFIDENELIVESSECLKLSVQDFLQSPLFQEAKNSGVSVSEDVRFVSSIEESIAQHITAIMDEESFLKIQALSPFFDNSAEGIKFFNGLTEKLELYIPEKNSSLPAELFLTDSVLSTIPVFTIRLEENKLDRFCHAKLYAFKSARTMWKLVTSANLSTAGMTNNQFPRNVEIGLLFKDDDRSIVKDLRDAEIKLVEDFSALILSLPSDENVEPVSASQDIPRVAAAFYDDGVIRVTLDQDVNGHVAVILVLDGNESGKFPVNADDGRFQFSAGMEIDGIQVIEIVVKSGDKSWETRRYPVNRRNHRPNHLPVLGATAFDRCLQMGGYDGVAQAFEFAKSSGREDWLWYLISRWDLGLILKGIDNENDVLDSELRIPTTNVMTTPDYMIQKVQKNVESLGESEILAGHLKEFSDGIIEQEDEKVIGRINEYLLPLCFSVSHYYFDVLRKQEDKKKENPSLRYPKYTWGHHCGKYITTLKPVINTCKKMVDSPVWDQNDNRDLRWTFSILFVFAFYCLNTPKTQLELREENASIKYVLGITEEDVNTLSSGASPSVDFASLNFGLISSFYRGDVTLESIPSALRALYEVEILDASHQH